MLCKGWSLHLVSAERMHGGAFFEVWNVPWLEDLQIPATLELRWELRMVCQSHLDFSYYWGENKYMCHDIYTMACHNWACCPTSPTPVYPKCLKAASILWHQCWALTRNNATCCWETSAAEAGTCHVLLTCVLSRWHTSSVHPRPLCKGETDIIHTLETAWLDSSHTAGKWQRRVWEKRKQNQRELLLLRVFSSFPMLLSETACMQGCMREGTRHSLIAKG